MSTENTETITQPATQTIAHAETVYTHYNPTIMSQVTYTELNAAISTTNLVRSELKAIIGAVREDVDMIKEQMNLIVSEDQKALPSEFDIVSRVSELSERLDSVEKNAMPAVNDPRVGSIEERLSRLETDCAYVESETNVLLRERKQVRDNENTSASSSTSLPTSHTSQEQTPTLHHISEHVMTTIQGLMECVNAYDEANTVTLRVGGHVIAKKTVTGSAVNYMFNVR